MRIQVAFCCMYKTQNTDVMHTWAYTFVRSSIIHALLYVQCTIFIGGGTYGPGRAMALPIN